jgi:hypothetical protein
MAKIPASTKTSLRQRLTARAEERWPQLADVSVTYRGQFAYVEGTLGDGEELRLFRLRYVGYASQWGFAIYRASHDDYQQALLPGGWHAGTPEAALDTACGLYLGDPTAWT